ncbi:MAG: acetyl-CoA synthetase, partial [Solirubrobacteraceae bacterium]|nr:acetyl-CoA synthetase [Solirubrobacteraceae bacterium]
MNFAVDVVEAADPDARALLELDAFGTREEWTFGAVAEGAGRLAGALHAAGVQREDVVLTLIGNRPAWVLAMVACFRQGYTVLPCNEQLRAKDLRMRLEVTRPAAIVADPRNREVIQAAGWTGPVLWDEEGPAPLPAELEAEDPCL